MLRSRENRRRRDPQEISRAFIAAVRRTLPALGWLTLTLLAGAATFYGTRSVYRAATTAQRLAIAEVEVNGAKRLTLDHVREIAGLHSGQNILTARLTEARAALLREPWIREAHVARQFPDHVRIDVLEREAIAQVELGGLYLIDEQGEVFKRADPQERIDLPIITGISRRSFESQSPEVAERLSTALSLLRSPLLGIEPGELSEIHFDSELGLTLFVGDPPTAVHLGEGRLKEKLWRYRRARAELQRRQLRASALYLDDERQPDHVGVALAGPTP
jgi:cell division protein FtsQ